MPRGATCSLDGDGQWHRRDTQRRQQNRERKRKRGVLRWWKGGGGGEEKGGRVGANEGALYAACTERKRRPRLARIRTRGAENRRTENRTANRSPIPKSADSQAGLVVSEPPNCSDAFSRGNFSFPRRVREHATRTIRKSYLWHKPPLKCYENSTDDRI